ncbi:hypothetical protein ITP53_37610 [Nonomuraea sp. K274]|uniref:Uncharacterized protein n=1 Tax=Nonomuraea cypriaca TaxID=1187855 RepID=A0A931AE70_9ACTN|nr:hypothetical protein [Nonomuraea cypriaca]MBF8191322.1 hypothetical protein [Nonomuraea cypriaca]
MIERADQLVLNYVSRAADAAHGVLKPDQRLDFARRLRARIEVERRGSQNARDVAKVLARFGDPVALVEREARRLAEAAAAAKDEQAASPGTSKDERAASPRTAASQGSTLRFPAITDDGAAPPGVRAYRRIAQERLSGSQGLSMPFAGLRRAAMSSANPMATGGRDARTIVKEHPRDVAAIVILVMAALLVPFELPPLAIFPIPLAVWAVGTAIVMFGESWELRDKLIGVGAPLLGYSLGGALIGGLRVEGGAGLQAFVTQFFDVSGTMFMIGTGVGVVWLSYRLLDVN